MPTGPDPRSDQELMAAHLGGDPQAFDELVRRHTDRLWAVAVRTVGNPHDAADALQEAFLSAFRAAPGWRGEAAVTTWLHRIVHRACLDRLRRRRTHRADPLDDDADPPLARDPVDDRMTSLDVGEALALLPVAQRAAVVLLDMEGMTVAEAAEVLEIPAGTVKSRAARARYRLAVLLGHLRPDAAEDGEPAGGNGSDPDGVEPPEEVGHRTGGRG